MAVTTHETPGETRLTLLDVFDLRVAGEPVVLQQPAQKLLALLALRGCRVSRETVALTIWLDEADASAALRSALYRLRRVAPWSVEAGDGWLEMSPALVVDVAERRQLVTEQLQAGHDVDVGCIARVNLDAPLLPDWSDEWVGPYRRREAELERHARDYLAERLADAGRILDAMDLALISIARDPLWERPYRIVAATHLHAGNPAQAILVFDEYRRLAARELGVAPSPQFLQLLGPVLRSRSPIRRSRGAPSRGRGTTRSRLVEQGEGVPHGHRRQ